MLWDALRKEPLEEEKEAGFSIAYLLRWAYPQNKNLVIIGEKDHEILESCLEFIFSQKEYFKIQRKYG